MIGRFADCRRNHAGGSRCFQRTGTLLQGRAGGADIVHQQNLLAVQHFTAVAVLLCAAAFPTAARTVTLTAGPLVLRGVTVLGELGDVLVLSNSADNRFYLVCTDTIGFFG